MRDFLSQKKTKRRKSFIRIQFCFFFSAMMCLKYEKIRHIGCYRGDLLRLLSCTFASVVDCNRRPHETSLLHCCKCGCIATEDLMRLLSCTVASVVDCNRRPHETSLLHCCKCGCIETGDLPRLLSCTVASVVDCNRRPHETSLLHCCKCGCIETGDLPRLLSCTVASVCGLQGGLANEMSRCSPRTATKQTNIHC